MSAKLLSQKLKWMKIWYIEVKAQSNFVYVLNEKLFWMHISDIVKHVGCFKSLEGKYDMFALHYTLKEAEWCKNLRVVWKSWMLFWHRMNELNSSKEICVKPLIAMTKKSQRTIEIQSQNMSSITNLCSWYHQMLEMKEIDIQFLEKK